MLKNNVKILHDGKSVVLNFYRAEEANSMDDMLVEVAVYYNGQMALDQIMTLKCGTIRQIYEDLRWGNENELILDGPFEHGWKIIKTPGHIRSYLMLTKKEIYNILLKSYQYYNQQ